MDNGQFLDGGYGRGRANTVRPTRAGVIRMRIYPLINRDNSCCFSGYRPEKLPWGSDESALRCLELKDKLIVAAEQRVFSGIRHFICGMARGCDTFFCEAVFFLRERHVGLTVEAAIPYDQHGSGWREDDRRRYLNLLGQCDFVSYVSGEYSRGCMLRRNRYMVDNSSVLIAVFDGKPGGTKNTLGYAMKSGLEVFEIAP